MAWEFGAQQSVAGASEAFHVGHVEFRRFVDSEVKVHWPLG